MDEQEQETAPTVRVRKADLAFEALVEETQSNPHFERGQINKALKGIRDAAFHEGILAEDLHVEIRLRAELYRRRWPGIELTPTALAKHWIRVAPAHRTASQEASEESRRLARALQWAGQIGFQYSQADITAELETFGLKDAARLEVWALIGELQSVDA